MEVKYKHKTLGELVGSLAFDKPTEPALGLLQVFSPSHDETRGYDVRISRLIKTTQPLRPHHNVYLQSIGTDTPCYLRVSRYYPHLMKNHSPAYLVRFLEDFTGGKVLLKPELLETPIPPAPKTPWTPEIILTIRTGLSCLKGDTYTGPVEINLEGHAMLDIVDCEFLGGLKVTGKAGALQSIVNSDIKGRFIMDQATLSHERHAFSNTLAENWEQLDGTFRAKLVGLRTTPRAPATTVHVTTLQ